MSNGQRRRTVRVWGLVALATVVTILTTGAAIHTFAGNRSNADSAEVPTAVTRCDDQLSSAVGGHHLAGDRRSLLVDTGAEGETSVLVSRSPFSGWCVGDDVDGSFLLIDSPWYRYPQPGDDAVSVGPQVQNTSKGGSTFILGRAGVDVIAVSLVVAGNTVPTTLDNGWWTATWKTGAEDELAEAQVSVTTRDGTRPPSSLRDLTVDD